MLASSIMANGIKNTKQALRGLRDFSKRGRLRLLIARFEGGSLAARKGLRGAKMI
jgi:hypothetical protein